MNEEVKALKSELALLKLQFSERIRVVEQRLDGMLAQQYPQDQGNLEQRANVASCSATQPPANKVIAPAILPVSVDVQKALSQVDETKAPSKLAVIFLILSTILSSLFDWFRPVRKIYQSYKARGMLGIFILTLAGATLTLAGFGYLMQLLIDQLGAGAKSLLIGFAAFSVMALGIGLKVNTRFTEFAATIVTLGILLCYSTVYFSGSVYQLIPGFVLLVLYLVIAIMCHALALWLDTKIVASLGIIGIASMPILSDTSQLDTTYYLLSLAFVSASSLILAYRRVGHWLASLTLAFAIVAIEWVIKLESLGQRVWIIDLFYVLFFAYVTIALLKEKMQRRHLLIFLAALTGATILMMFQSGQLVSAVMSFSFLVNTLIATCAAVLFYKVRHELTPLLVLLATLWAVLVIVSAISDSYWGIAWAVEGLLLIYIAGKYKITAVVNQGQALTLAALVYSWSALAGYFPLPALQSVDGWMLSIIVVAVIATWQRMIDKESVIFDDLARNIIKPTLQLVEVVWIAILLIASSNIWLGDWTGALVITLQLALLFRAKHCQQVSIEFFAAALITVPLFYYYQGVLNVASYRFTLLPLFAKLALISAFGQLWLWSAFYRKYQPDSAIKKIAEFTRILFYMLIPVCWLATAIRRLDENSLMILWLSPLLALFFAHNIKHRLLIFEAKIVTVATSLAFVFVAGHLKFVNSMITLVAFTAVYAIAYLMQKKHLSRALSQFICSCGLVSLGFALPVISWLQSDNLFYGAIVAALYWVGCFTALNSSQQLKRNETFITLVNIVLLISAWLMTLFEVIYALLPCLFLAAALIQKQRRFNLSSLVKKLGENCDLLLHTMAALTYTTLSLGLSGSRVDLLIAPALALHGALVLLIKHRRLTTVKFSFVLILLGIVKLSLLDAANALLWQKVILFMGIGVFILFASFWYQKVTKL